MKTFFTTFATLTTSISLLGLSQAAPLSDGPSCGVVGKTDESSFFSVVGVQGAGVQPRLELRELEKDTETWNIFLQAFARFQAMDQNDKVSYFKVAGRSDSVILTARADDIRDSWSSIWTVGQCRG
jgi:tyrosinase